MQSTAARAGVAIAAIAIVVIAFVVLSGDDSSDGSATPTTATVPTIVIEDGQPVDGVTDLSFNQGDTIEFDVESDAAHEIHFHGYDVMEDVGAGGSVEFSVPADIEGIFEVEIEDTATQIAEIMVNP